MDRIINNELVLGCAVLLQIENKDVALERLVISSVLLTDDSIRKSLSGSKSMMDFLGQKSRQLLVNKKFTLTLPIFVNSVVLLLQLGMVVRKGGKMCISDKGKAFLEMCRISSQGRLADIFDKAPIILCLIEIFKTAELYNKLNVML